MPLGFSRLNERSQRPNSNINFIKPLTSSSSSDQATAHDFLSRIAAQCYPVMKKHYISVMSLEEYPPNPEFLGRNFNAGEVIQLVLKDKAGRWLSFRFVQMVMMHELAHCKEMNHGRGFWQVRNSYAEEMKGLWAKKYNGEGLWGRGQGLRDGAFVHDRAPETGDVPEHLCGGTYRRGRGRKRKRGDGAGHARSERPEMSYAERQQKRIAKRFGIHGGGQGLGEDEMIRGALEQGQRGSGKPKVAKSKRGRELRANAALARFEAAKKQETFVEKTPKLEDDDDGSETDSEFEKDYGDSHDTVNKTLGIKDEQGRDLYQVCGDEGDDGQGGQDEMDELMLIGRHHGLQKKTTNQATRKHGAAKEDWPPLDGSETRSERDDRKGTNAGIKAENTAESETGSEPDEPGPGAKNASMPPTHEGTGLLQINEPVDIRARKATAKPASTAEVLPARIDAISQTSNINPPPASPTRPPTLSQPRPNDNFTCPICSLSNEHSTALCLACSHVLQPSLMPNHWRCTSEQCSNTEYVNAGDVGRCGLCGVKKLKRSEVAGAESARKSMNGPQGAYRGMDVLRWD